MRKLVANFLLFQAAWFICVLAPAGWDIAGGALILALHLKFIAHAGEWRFIALAAGIGSAIDSLLGFFNVFTFAPAYSLYSLLSLPIAPLWLILLWANFAATLPHSLSWMRRFPRIAFAAGAVAGPAAYWGGAAISDKLLINAAAPVFIAISALYWATLCALLPKLIK